MRLGLFLFFAILIGLFAEINAQDLKLAGIGSATYPMSGIKNGGQETKLSFQEYGGFFNIPYIFENKKTILVNGLGYARVGVTGENYPLNSNDQFKKHLHAMYYQMVIVRKLKNDWRLLVNFRPTISSDFDKKLCKDDFLFLGIGFVAKKVNEHYRIGGGVAYTTRFGRPFAIPILPLNYEWNKHSLNALFPIRLIYSYSIGEKEKLNIGFKQEINGAQFNITSSVNIQNTDYELNKVRYSRINMGGLVDYQLTNIIHLELFCGASVRRRYDLQDSSGKDYQVDLKESPFLNIAITLKPPMQK